MGFFRSLMNVGGALGAYAGGFTKGFLEEFNKKQNLSSEELMAEAINRVIVEFNNTLVCVCVMRNFETEIAFQDNDHYLAVIYGVADGVGQISKMPIEKCKKALQIYLTKYKAGESEYMKIMEVSSKAEHFFLIKYSGQAVFDAVKSQDTVGPMLELANKYLDSMNK